MNTQKVKVKDIKTGAIKEVNKSLASDYVGTGRFELVKEKEKKEVKTSDFKFNINKEEK